MTKTEEKYKAIALEYLTNGLDIRRAYKIFHPKVSDASLNVLPYKLLDNVRFKVVKEGLAKELDADAQEKAVKCLNILYSLAVNSLKEENRISSATNYLKFVKGEIHNNIPAERKAQLDELARSLGLNRLSVTQ